jgi:hypothetical protein
MNYFQYLFIYLHGIYVSSNYPQKRTLLLLFCLLVEVQHLNPHSRISDVIILRANRPTGKNNSKGLKNTGRPGDTKDLQSKLTFFFNS